MKSVVVFCGSGDGNHAGFTSEAFLLGKKLAEQDIQLIYGGARIGVMGAVAEGALSRGGKAIGVIPHFLRTKEVAHEGLTELIVVPSMHERKMKMHELCDGIIALPGGFGTLEELFEVLTWAQLGLHQKPIGIMNTNGYYNHLLSLIDSMLQKEFITHHHRSLFVVSETVDELLQMMKAFIPPPIKKWIHTDET